MGGLGSIISLWPFWCSQPKLISVLPFFFLPFICPVLFPYQFPTVPCPMPFISLAGCQPWLRPGQPWIFDLEGCSLLRGFPLLHSFCVQYMTHVIKLQASLQTSGYVKTARLMLPFGLGSAHHSQVAVPLEDKRLLLKDHKVPLSAQVLAMPANQWSCHREPHVAKTTDCCSLPRHLHSPFLLLQQRSQDLTT